MRKTLFALLLLSPVSAPAAVNESDDLMSLNYYPHWSRFALESNVNATIADQTANSNGGGAAVNSQSFLVGAAYGVRPGLRLGLSETLLWDSVSDAGPAATGGENASTSAGFANPTLTTAWRLVDDEDLHLSGDITFSMTPSLGAKLSANPALNTVGNDYDGASTLSFATAWFWRAGLNELELAPKASLALQGATNGNTASNSFNTLPYWYFAIALGDRLHLTDRLFLQGLVTYNYSHVSTLDFQDGTEKKQEAPNAIDPKATIGWSPQNNYLFTLGVAFHAATTITVTNGATQVGSRQRSATAELVFLHQL